jgi:hypothetical protein
MEKNDKVYTRDYDPVPIEEHYECVSLNSELSNKLRFGFEEAITKEDLEELIIIVKKRLKILEERNK